MIQNTSNKPLSELFSADNAISYQIPKYQREYVWNKWNWEALFDDIEESKGGHFLGSIICINNQKDTHKSAELELVDGQQRMTTISLFYLSIYKFLKENLDDPSDMDVQIELHSLKNRIILKDKNSVRLTPSYTNSNLDDYKFIFSREINEVKALKLPKFMGNRQIARAFNYFLSRLNAVTEEGTPIYNYQTVKALLSKLNSATLVKIDVANHADAFTLFETLNNRGIPLSAIDIIKNKLLGFLERRDNSETHIDENFERWNQILQNLTDDYNIQERFLRQFYNAFKTESTIEVHKISKAVRSNLIKIYDELIDRDVDLIFDRLEEASEIYSKNIQYEIEAHSNELIHALRNLENVFGVDGYMILLFIEKKFEIKESDKIEIVNFLCKYFIRRNVTDNPPTRDLTNIFIDIIQQVNQLSTYDFEKIKEAIIIKGKPSSDELFEEKLKGDLYEENIGATRYILSAIEHSISHTKERFTNFYSRSKNIFIWTVEHILPQGNNIPIEWINMIADGDSDLAANIKKDWVHKLGNLTLTAYNSNLSNLSLSKKQERKNSDGKYIGFKNGLSINDLIKDLEIWNRDSIQSRTELLVSKALEIFKLEEVK